MRIGTCIYARIYVLCFQRLLLISSRLMSSAVCWRWKVSLFVIMVQLYFPYPLAFLGSFWLFENRITLNPTQRDEFKLHSYYSKTCNEIKDTDVHTNAGKAALLLYYYYTLLLLLLLYVSRCFEISVRDNESGLYVRLLLFFSFGCWCLPSPESTVFVFTVLLFGTEFVFIVDISSHYVVCISPVMFCCFVSRLSLFIPFNV